MFFIRAYKIPTVVIGIFFITCITGCDKIPFLSKFFPSKEKKVEQKPQAVPAPASDVLAKVGSWTLTKEEFNKKLENIKEIIPDYDINNPEARKLILEELIRQQLLVDDAEKRGLDKGKDITSAVHEFRRTLLVREVTSKLTEGLEATLSDAQDYYNQNKNDFVEPAEWRLREIMVPTQEEAKEILVEILKGADFAVMAQTRSKSASASKGGDLGFAKEFKFPQMEMAVSTLETGDVSSVFKGPNGYYIVKVQEKKGGKPIGFSSVADEIKAGLTLRKQQEKMLEYIDSLKQKTTVEVHEELLK